MTRLSIEQRYVDISGVAHIEGQNMLENYVKDFSDFEIFGGILGFFFLGILEFFRVF